MKQPIFWRTIVILAILALLGIGVPFWMEYRSLTSGQPDALHGGRRQPSLDAKLTFFCPICGEEISLPHWRTATVNEGRLVAPLQLRKPIGSEWEIPVQSTVSAKTQTQLHD